MLLRVGVSVPQRQKILLAPAAAPVAVSRIPISQAWRCQPFRTVAGVPAGLAVPLCHVWVCLPVPGHICPVLSPLCRSWGVCRSWDLLSFMWLCSCGTCTGMLLPRVLPPGWDVCRGSPQTRVLAFCTTLGCCSLGWLLP